MPERLGGGGAARLAHQHRLHPRAAEPLGEGGGEGGLPRSLRPLEHHEESVAHASVMMLLVEPRSMPAVIS